tara:strand:- start:17 stop:205 length:189 start_codon:yes stop_codon:yes gene_type:complete
MDNMQTIDVILALKELKHNAKKAKQDAIESLAEAEGVLSSVKFLEEQFSMQIEMYNKSRKVE